MINLPIRAIRPRSQAIAASAPRMPSQPMHGAGINPTAHGRAMQQQQMAEAQRRARMEQMLTPSAGGLAALSGLFDREQPQASTVTQMASPQGGMAHDLGVAAVPGGIGNVAAPGASQATGIIGGYGGGTFGPGKGGLAALSGNQMGFLPWLRGLFA